MNRRDVFGYLAGIPLVGLLFSNPPEVEAITMTTEWCDRPIVPYLTIPSKEPNGLMTCIPLNGDFELVEFSDKGPLPIHRVVEQIISKRNNICTQFTKTKQSDCVPVFLPTHKIKYQMEVKWL